MFTKATVFVLGAGVSVPFGFPSGEGLIRDIVRSTQGEQDLMKKMLHYAVKPEERKKIDPFFHHLGRASDRSIDRWLESNPSYLEIGRWAIAFVIACAEKRTKHRIQEDTDWFHWLWNAMRTDKVTRLKENRVSFITFNYDRLLESKLDLAIADSYPDATDVEREAAVSELHSRIIHIHGALSAGWASPENFGLIYPLSPGMAHIHMMDAVKWAEMHAKGIRIISENIEDSGVLEKAHSSFTNSERTIFLGFGYEGKNMDRLAIRIHQGSAKMSLEAFKKIEFVDSPIMGSTYGLDEGEREAIRRTLGGFINLDPSGLDARAFCRRYVVVG